jgi:hypothetical protein
MCATHLLMSSTAIIYNCLSGRVARVIDKERGVLATGWGALAANNTPDDIFVLEAVPHDWRWLALVYLDSKDVILFDRDLVAYTRKNFTSPKRIIIPVPFSI